LYDIYRYRGYSGGLEAVIDRCSNTNGGHLLGMSTTRYTYPKGEARPGAAESGSISHVYGRIRVRRIRSTSTAQTLPLGFDTDECDDKQRPIRPCVHHQPPATASLAPVALWDCDQCIRVFQRELDRSCRRRPSARKLGLTTGEPIEDAPLPFIKTATRVVDERELAGWV
jgi:hypothetical protein